MIRTVLLLLLGIVGSFAQQPGGFQPGVPSGGAFPGPRPVGPMFNPAGGIPQPGFQPGTRPGMVAPGVGPTGPGGPGPFMFGRPFQGTGTNQMATGQSWMFDNQLGGMSMGSNQLGGITMGSNQLGGMTMGSNQLGGMTMGSNQLGGLTMGSNQLGGITMDTSQLGGFTFDSNQLGGLTMDTSLLGGTGTGFGNSFGFGSSMPPASPVQILMQRVAANPNNYRYATCVFNETWSPVRGRLDFRQFLIGEGNQQVSVRVQLSGLPAAVGEVERGIHVHEFGDTGDGCARVGPHFNPNQTPHGSRRNFAFLRHVGNLGNIRQSSNGLVSTQFVDTVISLEGVNNIVGRALAIKFERDDEGLGRTRDSQVNGNTHTPIACCTIGRTTARNWYNPMSVQHIQTMAATGEMPYYTVNQNMFGANPGLVPNTNTNPSFPGALGGLQGPMGGAVAGQQFGAGTFMPGGAPGQTFNFGAQGKK